MKFRWLLAPLLALQLVSARAAEADTLSVDFPDISVAEMCTHLTELFPIVVELPGNFVDFKKSLKLRDVTWYQILSEGLDGSDYYCVCMPDHGVVLKKGERAPERYHQFIAGTWGPLRNPDKPRADELQREFRADGTYEVTLLTAVAGADPTRKVLVRGKWTVQAERLEIVLTETLDPSAVPDAGAGVWEIRSFRTYTTVFSNPRSGLSLLLQRRDL